ncbi:hypothetical protein ISS07_03305 [Candidatus Woesearchaeota archaeon]|nr:hypothetical protein [Candidatus Woesearchaeota archaeon]
MKRNERMKRGVIMDKKAFVTVHAGMFFIIGIVIGAALMYYLITKGMLPIGVPTA